METNPTENNTMSDDNTTMEERAYNFGLSIKTSELCTNDILAAFGQQEADRVMKECYEAVKKWTRDDGCLDELLSAILAVGKQKPKSPFGCKCWEQPKGNSLWYRHDSNTPLRDDAKYCDQCGRPREVK